MAVRQALFFRVGAIYNLSSLIAGQQRSQQAVFGFMAVCTHSFDGPITTTLVLLFGFAS